MRDDPLMQTLDRLKTKLVDDRAESDVKQRRPGSASRKRGLIPLKCAQRRLGATRDGCAPAQRAGRWRRPCNPYDGEKFLGAIPAAKGLSRRDAYEGRAAILHRHASPPSGVSTVITQSGVRKWGEEMG